MYQYRRLASILEANNFPTLRLDQSVKSYLFISNKMLGTYVYVCDVYFVRYHSSQTYAQKYVYKYILLKDVLIQSGLSAVAPNSGSLTINVTYELVRQVL